MRVQAVPVFLLLSAPSFAQDDYYPLHPGYQWVFTTASGSGAKTVEQKTEKVGDVECVRVIDEAIAGDMNQIWYHTTKEGVWIHKLGKTISRPIQILNTPIRKDDKFKHEFDNTEENLKCVWETVVEGMETVEYKGRKLRCWKVKFYYEKQDNEKVTILAWLAPGLGEVRRKILFVFGDTKEESEYTYTKINFDPAEWDWDKIIANLKYYSVKSEGEYEYAPGSHGYDTFKKVEKVGSLAYPFLVKYIDDENPEWGRAAVVCLQILTGYRTKLPRNLEDAAKIKETWRNLLSLKD